MWRIHKIKAKGVDRIKSLLIGDDKDNVRALVKHGVFEERISKNKVILNILRFGVVYLMNQQTCPIISMLTLLGV
jgi:hypothetical protein